MDCANTNSNMPNKVDEARRNHWRVDTKPPYELCGKRTAGDPIYYYSIVTILRTPPAVKSIKRQAGLKLTNFSKLLNLP